MNLAEPEQIILPPVAVGQLMPMHAIVSPTGHIISAGPTLQKLRPGKGFLGTRFFTEFQVSRPRGADTIAGLAATGGRRLSLRLHDRPDVTFKGLAIALPGNGGVLVNLSFGIAAVDAVGIFGLSGGDFSATDLTVEMLYMVEAKEAVLKESRSLNLRLECAKIAAEEQAYTDTLTGLKNRRAMDMLLERYAVSNEKFGLMHLDLDYFKQVNDRLGHAAGDLVLQETARILVEETRADDTVVRVGGDEFVLLLHRLTDPGRLAKVARRILKRLALPILYREIPCGVSGSIGITVSDDYTTPDPGQMLIDADMALYESKNAGRAQFTFGRDVGRVAQAAARDGHPPAQLHQHAAG